MNSNNSKTVVVTGITGFLGSHIAIQLLNRGFNVRGTLRSLDRSADIKKIIHSHVANSDATLSFFECDLMVDDGWDSAMVGADYVIHSASPFLSYVPKDENELITPAVDGTLRVLKAANKHQIQRVVLTSSVATVLYGEDQDIQTELSWSNPDNKRVTPYYKSKTLAERAAWDYANQSGLELTTVLPGIILGPVLESDYGTSAEVIIKLMDKSLPAIPKLGFTISDVRDVAEAHILAMTSDAANGERFLATGDFMWMSDIAEVLRSEYPNYKIPKYALPNTVARLVSYFDPALKTVVEDLNYKHNVDNTKTREKLNWQPRAERESILATAQSLIKHGAI
ncbi:SDR family oxidoreductase [Vibrio sp. RC27]